MLLQFLLCIAFAAANDVEMECDSCIRVDGVCHNVSHVLDFNNTFRETVVITKLGILRDKNTLYYAFEPNISDPEYYKIGYVNLDNPETQGVLEGGKPVTNFRTFDFDQDKKIIYIGGGDAIYMSENGDKAYIISSNGDTIQSIVFKKNLYFVRYGENKIIEKEGELFNVLEKYTNIKNFVIDKNSVIVYLNISGLYANKMGTNDTVQLSRNAFIRGLTVDLDGVVYTWWIDGIYKVIIDSDLLGSKLVKVANIPTIGAVTFDNDNYLLFSSEKGLYRLITLNSTLC